MPNWRMPPLEELAPAKLSLAAKLWMGVLRLYLVVAGGLVLMRIVDARARRRGVTRAKRADRP